MAFYYKEPAHTFSEYLLVPGYSSEACIPANVDLRTPLVKFKKGEEPAITMNIPMVSAIMQSVSGEKLAVALSKEGGISFIYGSQTIEDEAAMVARVKAHRAGFVTSDSNIRPDSTLADILALKERTGHSTVAVTSDGTVNGKLVGIVTSRDYRPSRMARETLVKEFMTPIEQMIVAPKDITLQQANDMIWDNKLNTLPVVDDEGRLLYMVFRRDYATHKEYPLELLDSKKFPMVNSIVYHMNVFVSYLALVQVLFDKHARHNNCICILKARLYLKLTDRRYVNAEKGLRKQTVDNRY